MGSPRPSPGHVLVVFDFDWSLINDNSDTWVIKQLTPDFYAQLMGGPKAQELGWTDLMDHALCQMMGPQLGITREQLTASLEAIPYFPEMFEAVRYAHAQGAEIVVLSDANTYYITTILERHGLAPLVTEVITNPSRWDGGTLRVAPHHDAGRPPHGCALCPPNLCKGLVMEALLQDRKPAKVVYVGDGGGDFCPSTKLRAGDALCCRKGWTCHKKAAAAAAPGGPGPTVVAELVPWEDGAAVLAYFQASVPCPAGALA